MTLQQRIGIMVALGEYMRGSDENWLAAKERAYRENPWFIPEFIDRSTENIASRFLQPTLLQNWALNYGVPVSPTPPKTVGIVMAGNIPLVGFHDLLCVFISGHNAMVKLSAKDEILTRHLAEKLFEWEPATRETIQFAERLNGCDAYIATGSNNSGRYFEYYFGKYPHIIRKNRTSVAVLDNTETKAELEALAADIQVYFGLGCRNVTQLYVPQGYDFIPLLDALRSYEYFMDYHKYKNNFDYHLALLIMGNKYYMNNDTVILTENESPFSPVSQVHYAFYDDRQLLDVLLGKSSDIQCVTGHGYIPFGQTQSPRLTDYADGIDTMAFLAAL